MAPIHKHGRSHGTMGNVDKTPIPHHPKTGKPEIQHITEEMRGNT